MKSNYSAPDIKVRIKAWDRLYGREGLRWGEFPSLAAYMALPHLARISQPRPALLDCGCGYARDLLLFRAMFRNFELDGLDASSRAYELSLARQPNPSLGDFFVADVFDANGLLLDQRYDIIFSNYFFHLFLKDECLMVLKLIKRSLKQGGLLISSFVSEDDRHFGKGRKVESGCYEVRRGIPWSFVSQHRLRDLCHAAGYQPLSITPYVEVELANNKPDPVNGLFLVASPDV